MGFATVSISKQTPEVGSWESALCQKEACGICPQRHPAASWLDGCTVSLFDAALPKLATATCYLCVATRPSARTPLGVSPKRERNSRLKCEISEKPTSDAMSEIRRELSPASVSSVNAFCPQL
jgi:hypothetical protein